MDNVELWPYSGIILDEYDPSPAASSREENQSRLSPIARMLVLPESIFERTFARWNPVAEWTPNAHLRRICMAFRLTCKSSANSETSQRSVGEGADARRRDAMTRSFLTHLPSA